MQSPSCRPCCFLNTNFWALVTLVCVVLLTGRVYHVVVLNYLGFVAYRVDIAHLGAPLRPLLFASVPVHSGQGSNLHLLNGNASSSLQSNDLWQRVFWGILSSRHFCQNKNKLKTWFASTEQEIHRQDLGRHCTSLRWLVHCTSLSLDTGEGRKTVCFTNPVNNCCRVPKNISFSGEKLFLQPATFLAGY